MYAPLYSPLAAEGERCLPHYTPILWASKDVNPFDTLVPKSSADESLFENSHDDDLIAPTSIIEPPTRRPISRFPLITTRTFPTYNYDPWSTIRRSQAFEPPPYTPPADLPQYGSVNPHARTFRLCGPFVHASKTSNLPQYQIAHQFDRFGKPSKLKLRRLRPSETRACSVPAIRVAREPSIRYDDDETLYTMSGDEMHGNDLVGAIQVTSGRTLWGGSWTKIWHVVRSSRESDWNSGRGSAQRPRSLHDGDKILLYTIRKGVWEDADGTVVAREEIGEGKVVEIGETWARDKDASDLVVGCWVLKAWWEGHLSGDLEG